MAGAIRAFSKCRNESLRLPAFLEHYRRLGVEQFVVVDNDSTDGSHEYLARQPDVRVFRTTARFRDARGGTDWLNARLAELGAGSWCVTVDIDELLCYPGSEETPLPVLTEYLDRNGYQALSCLLLDLYPRGPLSECRYQPGDDPVAAAPYFDRAPYTAVTSDMCPGVLIRGGMRERVFYPEFRSDGLWARVARRLRRLQPPCLTKVPLVRWDDGTAYLHNNHFVSPRTLAPDTGVLLHVKFLHDFHQRAVQEASRGEYYDGAAEYKRYAARIAAEPNLSLAHEGSMRFVGTGQLVQLGLMRETKAWADHRVTGTT